MPKDAANANTTVRACEGALLPTAAVARWIGADERTVRQMGADGRLPGYVRVGRVVRFKWAVIEKWLATDEV